MRCMVHWKTDGVAPTMQWLWKLGMIAMHALVAMVVTVILGVILAGELGHALKLSSQNRWVDVPYSPVIWGTALICAYLLNVRFQSRASMWVWTFGLTWFVILLADVLRFHDPRWCQGCSLARDIWNTYFAWDYRKCADSNCLGEVFGTTPLVNSIAYSLGAWLAMRSKSENSSTAQHPSLQQNS
jgi:hypothetical protein